MSGAPVTHRRRRNANCGGDHIESKRLRGPFLRWSGRRTHAAALKAAGIDYHHGMRWLSETGILADRYQAIVRDMLDRSGIEVSPCS